MISKLSQNIRLYLRQETDAERWQRMRVCALIGVPMATIFVWTVSTINLITLPGQHLGVDWHRLWFYWISFGTIAGILGIFVGWFTENYEGSAYGWIPVELLTLLVYLVYTSIVQTAVTTVLVSIRHYSI